jgi:hypothetical protein
LDGVQLSKLRNIFRLRLRRVARTIIWIYDDGELLLWARRDSESNGSVVAFSRNFHHLHIKQRIPSSLRREDVQRDEKGGFEALCSISP